MSRGIQVINRLRSVAIAKCLPASVLVATDRHRATKHGPSIMRHNKIKMQYPSTLADIPNSR